MNQPLPPSASSPVARSAAPAGSGPRRWQRRLPWIGGAVLLVLIVIGLWPKPVLVESAAVTRGGLRVTVDDQGQTRVKNRYVVSTPVAGQLQRIDWKAGAPVVAGQTVLAVLETGGADLLDARGQAQAEARVRGAESARDMAAARREAARATAALAQTDFERMTQLHRQKAISQQEFDAATLRQRVAAEDARAAEFAFQVAEFELAQARALLLRGTAPRPTGSNATEEPPIIITSPVNGSILRVFQESARVVPGGFPLMEVGDSTDLEVRIELLSRDGVQVRPGARVFLEQWGGAQPLEARVRLVEPSAFTKISALGVEEQRVYVVADFTDPVEKRPTLGDSYRVEARVVVWEGANVLKVPAGALFQRGDTWQTYMLDGGTARLRTVKAGHTNGLETEIVDGLREGDRVIVYPGDKIADGVRARPMVVSPR
ncbi:MAG TPA: HlyD family efflux transporter periplasmic adaptor subunit [Opitutaceae bacterium]|nr:HlyD family efflux transporter periplasmic adaptor subunit [Opitutaceae bacterium]